jgi:hypothetical protein
MIGLNDTERLVLDCKTMRLKENEALAYLKLNGKEIAPATFYRVKARLEAEKLKRLHFYAARFDDRHLERIERLEWVEQEMIRCAVIEQDPYKKSVILERIANLQPYLSAYDEATKDVIEGKHAQAGEEDIDIPDMGSTKGSEPASQ